ncbi:hypothetical protein [Coleofasciculus sp.]
MDAVVHLGKRVAPTGKLILDHDAIADSRFSALVCSKRFSD